MPPGQNRPALPLRRGLPFLFGLFLFASLAPAARAETDISPAARAEIDISPAARAETDISPAARAPTTIALDLLRTGMPDGTAEVTMTLDPAVAAMAPAPDDSGLIGTDDVLGEGVASWYGGRRWAGRRTASGSRFNQNAMTAASATLPLGTRVLVRLEGTARSVLVTITDRLGAVDRIIDLSRAAARKIGILGRGTARVVLVQM